MRGKLATGLAAVASSIRGLLARRRKARLQRATGQRVEQYLDRLVADAILFNETPSPTPREEQRTAFITRRLEELDVPFSQDERSGNILVRFPGSGPAKEPVLLFASIENEDYSPLESLVKLGRARASGQGLAGNSLGVAALLVLAEHMQKSGTVFARSLDLLFTGLAGAGVSGSALERFLDHAPDDPCAAFYLTGTTLGTIARDPVGTCRLDVSVRTREREVSATAGSLSAVSVLSDIAQKLGGIRWDTAGDTFLNVARLEAGAGYGRFAAEGRMELEIFARDTARLETSRDAVLATTRKVGEQTGASIRIETAGLIPAGDAELRGPLVEALRRVHAKLGIRTRLVSRPDPTALLNARGIPALSLGLTTGGRNFREEYVDLAPLESGFQQLLLLLEGVAGR